MQLEKLIVVNNHFQLQWEDKQNCYVLLYPEGMVQLSQSAGEIMNLCDGKNSILEIIQILEKKFNTTDLQADICYFIEDAIGRSWLTYSDEKKV